MATARPTPHPGRAALLRSRLRSARRRDDEPARGAVGHRPGPAGVGAGGDAAGAGRSRRRRRRRHLRTDQRAYRPCRQPGRRAFRVEGERRHARRAGRRRRARRHRPDHHDLPAPELPAGPDGLRERSTGTAAGNERQLLRPAGDLCAHAGGAAGARRRHAAIPAWPRRCSGRWAAPPATCRR